MSVLGLVVACGGSTASSSSSTPEKGASRVTMEDEHGKHEVTGPAFALVDTGQKQLVVFTFRPDTEPRPSCELVLAPSTMKRGGFVSFAATGFGGAPGNYPVGQGSAILGDPDKGDLTLLSAPVAATSFSLQSFGSDAFQGEVTSTGALPKVVGTVSGRVCPSIQSPVTLVPPVQSAEGAPADPPPTTQEKSPPVVAKLDTDGVAGITLGMPAKKLPKGTSKKPPVPQQAKGLTVYDAKGVLYMGEPIVEANISVAGGAVVQMTASIGHCDRVLGKLKERYGESGTTGLDGSVWRGKKNELTLIPFQGGTCLITFAKIPPKRTGPASAL